MRNSLCDLSASKTRAHIKQLLASQLEKEILYLWDLSILQMLVFVGKNTISFYN